MTWIRLKKKATFNGKDFPVGRILPIDPQIAKEMVEKKQAEVYDGPRPPKEKLKIEFFKPKD